MGYIKSDDIYGIDYKYLQDLLLWVKEIRNILSSLSISLSPNVLTYNVISGSIVNNTQNVGVANMNSVVFYNVGSGDATIAGFPLRPNSNISISVSAPHRLNSIFVDATNTTVRYILTYH